MSVVDLARDLIRIDTSNIPDPTGTTMTGHETLAAEHLAAYLSAAGIECELVAREPHRANLIARIRGDGTGPSLAFVGHTDVVPADRGSWLHPPFAGVIDDEGFLHGRGALDMKGEVAARAVAMATLARRGFRPRGDLWFLAVADEEDGTADVGMRWLLEQRPDIRPEMAVNEGGGELLELEGRSFLTVSLGEKGTFPARLSVIGEAGHASRPSAGSNPIPALSKLLTRLDRGLPTSKSTPWLIEALTTVLDSPVTDVDSAVEIAGRLHPSLAGALPPMGGTTMAPTMLKASTVRNIIPGEASAELDCRVVPGATAAQVEQDIRSRLGDDVAYTLSWPEPFVAGSSSPSQSELMTAIKDFLATTPQSPTVLPILDSGFTDSVHLRAVANTVAYGVNPYLNTPSPVLTSGFHNVNERVHVDDLQLSVDFHLFMAERLLGSVPG